MALKHNEIYLMDCKEGLKQISDQSIDFICVDLPYGITARNKWDNILPMNEYIVIENKYIELEQWLKKTKRGTYKIRHKEFPTMEKRILYFEKNKCPGLWQHYERILKPNGAICLFGVGLFTAYLMYSNPNWWRYNLIWKKESGTDFLNANRKPMRIHEDICIFYKHLPTYHPQKTTGHSPVHAYTKHTSDGTNYGRTKLKMSGGGSTERYPTTILEYPTDKQKEHFHPTQKPLDLIKNLIRTYTNEQDLCLDHCSGSGTLAVAAFETNRNFICMENNETYYNDSRKRLKQHGFSFEKETITMKLLYEQVR